MCVVTVSRFSGLDRSKHLVDDSYCGLLDVGDRYVVPFYSVNVESVIVPLALSPTDLAEGESC